jgi:cell division protease FtsH
MAAALLEWETIDAEQIQDIIEGRPPRPPQTVSPSEASDNSPPPGLSSAGGSAAATPV